MYDFHAILERVIDGDTVILTVDVGFRFATTARFRLAHINAPEMSTADGHASRDHLMSLIPARGPLIAHTYKDPDNYGRWLAELIVAGTNVNQKMIDDGFAVPYVK